MTLFSKTVTVGDDTAEERTVTGNMYLNSSDLEMCRDGSTLQECGIRVQGVTIPQGYTIDSAYFTLEPVNSSTASGTVTISGEDIDDAPAITSGNSNITNRTKTSASVDWSPGTYSSGTSVNTADIKSVVQEIVDRDSWASGNDMMFMFHNVGSTFQINVRSSNSSGLEPILVINYSESSGSSLTASIGDGLASSDEESLVMAWASSISDGLSAGESVGAIASLSSLLSDSLGLVDSHSEAASIVSSLSDELSLGDGFNQSFVLVKSIGDSLASSDGASASLVSVVFDDSVNLNLSSGGEIVVSTKGEIVLLKGSDKTLILSTKDESLTLVGSDKVIVI